MAAWEKFGLNGREMKKARSEAGRFLGLNPVKWEDMGLDIQQVKVDGYLQHLRETDNKTIAEKLMDNKDSVYEILRIRTKTIRNKKTKSHSAANTGLPSIQVDSPSIANLTGNVAPSEAGMEKNAS